MRRFKRADMWTSGGAQKLPLADVSNLVDAINRKLADSNKIDAKDVEQRLLSAAKEAQDAAASDARRSQVRTVDRSERIRTYNFPENRISDHRTNFKSYNLSAVLDGDLEAVIQSLVDADTAAKLSAVGATDQTRRS